MLYVKDSSKYDRPNVGIDCIKVIQEIVKKSGLRCRIEAPPNKQSIEKTITDAEKR